MAVLSYMKRCTNMTGRIRRRLGIAGVICALALFLVGGDCPGVARIDCGPGRRFIGRRAARRHRHHQEQRHERRRLVTNDTGQYTAVLLLPGTYSVTAELSGFQSKDYPKVQVHVGERVQLDATLRPPVSPNRSRSSARARSSKPARHRWAGDQHHAHQRDSARRRHRLWPDAADPGRVVRAVVCAAAADGQRQPSRHDDHGDDQQRVHDRRIEQRRVAGARRHSAAVGRDRGVQGRNRGLRRADRPHRAPAP